MSFLGSVASAKEYHVAPHGNDKDAGTAAAPWKTIQHAADSLHAGDVCVLHGGTYRETVRPDNSGRPGAPIRFVATKAETVIVTGTQQVTAWSAHRGKIYKATVRWPVDQVFAHLVWLDLEAELALLTILAIM